MIFPFKSWVVKTAEHKDPAPGSNSGVYILILSGGKASSRRASSTCCVKGMGRSCVKKLSLNKEKENRSCYGRREKAGKVEQVQEESELDTRNVKVSGVRVHRNAQISNRKKWIQCLKRVQKSAKAWQTIGIYVQRYISIPAITIGNGNQLII
ncbi:unnamed protein product [Allacma fusca]|uniref:Uncharacterized protein n=1 Tax=Allacma fusca TaxID=39272 RepID=A0A8J2JL48_9HEXA|nr:unnamed protein product [Allacma fusca]